MKSFIITCLAASSAFAAPLALPQFGIGSSTKNDVTNGVCKPVTYIFARGTTEPGNMGSTVGPALSTALQSAFGSDKVATQGVDYPADIAGAISGALSPGSAQGARRMVTLTQQALRNCPDTKVVLAGYSQGAEQVHGALQNLQNGNVAVALTFGDPLQRSPFRNIDAKNTKVYCAIGDAVCSGQFIISAAHLSYANRDVTSAAQFAKGIIGAV